MELDATGMIKIRDVSGATSRRGIILLTKGIKSYTLVNSDGDGELHTGWTTDVSYPSTTLGDSQSNNGFKDYAVKKPFKSI